MDNGKQGKVRGKQSLMYKAFFVLISWCLMLTGCTSDEPEFLTIATAANMQAPMEALLPAFTASTGIPCQSIVSSSGKLTAQIKAGAPYDVFVSANEIYPLDLFTHGKTVQAPKRYATGKLVIWTTKPGLAANFETMTTEAVAHIAIANPQNAPYGQAAVQALKMAGIYKQVETKLVYGESIAQTHQFIAAQSADIGFTALSVIRSVEGEVAGQWKEVDAELYTPVAQAVVVVKNRPQQIENASAFQDFLFSDQGKEILVNFGYEVDTE